MGLSNSILAMSLVAGLLMGCGERRKDARFVASDSAQTVSRAVPAGQRQSFRLPDSLARRLVAVTVVGPRLVPKVLVGGELPAGRDLSAGNRYLLHLRIDSIADLRALIPASNGPLEPVLLAPASLPPDLAQAPVDIRKRAFFQGLAPAVLFHNATVQEQRQYLQQVLSAGVHARAGERAFIAEMIAYYGMEDAPFGRSNVTDTVRALLTRVDIVPASIVLAQAAMESGWGSSRFSRHGNNLFGQRVWAVSSAGMVARGARGSPFRLAVFRTLGASVGSYLRNINSHPAYADFRRSRKRMRDRSRPLEPLELVRTLTEYSERGSEYVRDVSIIIRHNRLQRYDALFPAPAHAATG